MNEPAPPVVVDLRIPGRWSHPRELIQRLPDGCRVTPESLVLPDGARVNLGFREPDDQFPGIFRSSCRQPPTEEELTVADGYTVNVLLSGEGGSTDAARTATAAPHAEPVALDIARILARLDRLQEASTLARSILEAFLATPFEGGRHQRRVEKMDK